MQRAVPDPGLPVLPELARAVREAASRPDPEPVGGSLPLRTAAAGYFHHRGLHAAPERTLLAPGGQPLLLALLSAAGGPSGAVLLPRPAASWYAPLAQLLGRPVYGVAVPSESGGAPDPFALLETLRRIRAEGGDPRVLVLSVADDPTGTVPAPEMLHETCEAAAGEGLLIISDETYRDTLHDVHGTVTVSPAEMLPEDVIVLADLAGSLLPPSWPAALAHFPDTVRGVRLHRDTRTALEALRAELPATVAAACALALEEPPAVKARTAEAARLHAILAAALDRTLTAAGAICRAPQAGCHVYADFEPVRPALERRGVRDAVELEAYLLRRLGEGRAAGGHRFGDELNALRARLGTGPLTGPDDEARARTLAAEDPLELPHVAQALASVGSALSELTGAPL